MTGAFEARAGRKAREEYLQASQKSQTPSESNVSNCVLNPLKKRPFLAVFRADGRGTFPDKPKLVSQDSAGSDRSRGGARPKTLRALSKYSEHSGSDLAAIQIGC